MPALHDLSEPPIAAPVPALQPDRLVALRRQAATRLGGPAAIQGDTARAADALGVLHALASSQDTAADALALLHELQVYQVELELQAQELRESRADLESSLRRLADRHDRQPAGAFTIDARCGLLEVNGTGAALLGVATDDALGLPLDAFLDPAGAQRFRSALARVGADRPRVSCRVDLRARDGAARSVLASVAVDITANRYLVSMVDIGEALDAADAADLPRG